MPRSGTSLRPTLRWALILALAAFVAIFAVACGSDDGINDDPEPVAEKSEPADPVMIDTDGQEFDAPTVYRETVPGVISVRSIFGESADPLEGRAAGGSGFVLSDEGEIVTNAH